MTVGGLSLLWYSLWFTAGRRRVRGYEGLKGSQLRVPPWCSGKHKKALRQGSWEQACVKSSFFGNGDSLKSTKEKESPYAYLESGCVQSWSLVYTTNFNELVFLGSSFFGLQFLGSSSPSSFRPARTWCANGMFGWATWCMLGGQGEHDMETWSRHQQYQSWMLFKRSTPTRYRNLRAFLHKIFLLVIIVTIAIHQRVTDAITQIRKPLAAARVAQR